MKMPRLSGWSLRARLTALYSGLFVLAGAVLIVLIYLLIQSQSITSVAAQQAENAAPLPEAATEAVPGENPDYTTVTVARLVEDSFMTELLTQGALALLVTGLIAGLLGWWITGRQLRPLAMVTGAARSLATAGRADPGRAEKVGLSGPGNEVKELADTFDTMIDRLRDSFDDQKRFIANASHELRTPVAVSRGLAEVAMNRPTATPEMKELGEKLLQVSDRQERLIGALLQLAQSDRPVAEPESVDLEPVLEHLTAEYEDAYPQVRWVLDTDPGRVAGDPVMIEQLLRNLLDNAGRHNSPDGGLVEVSLTASDRTVLTVSNTGAPFTNGEAADLLKPFYRGRLDRVAGPRGSGLGLSITEAVVHSHNGTLQVEPRVGGGLTISADFPSHETGVTPPAIDQDHIHGTHDHRAAHDTVRSFD
ncbi:sensor histidine kinase [Haloglycomyces albus]|uniref:sensor histidine kinase n=1 Tax=Haloglycomyces albus TaxID=526067 RepID=UPI0004B6B8CA|nr:HAMP domain-containing sensor histidine kinase [Haloglycomyces albus]